MDNLRRCIFAVLLTFPILAFSGDIININTADKESLMAIKGVGEKRAAAIIDYREQHGPFNSVEQLAEIKGIGPYFVDVNREILTVEDNN